MKPVDLMIFDLDGTLVTSGRDICASVNHALVALGLPALEEPTVLEYIGDGIRRLIERSLGPASQDRFEEALTIFSRHYDEHMLDTTILYPGVVGMLRHFRAKKKIILTNKRHRFAAAMSDALQLTPFFDDVVGADSTPYIKPDVRLADRIINQYHVHPDRTVVIGDGVNDILLAKNAGLVSCAFLEGLTARQTLLDLKPDYLCEHLSEITGFFC
jgi:phosphoglycolate phosphatase